MTLREFIEYEARLTGCRAELEAFETGLLAAELQRALDGLPPTNVFDSDATPELWRLGFSFVRRFTQFTKGGMR